MAHRFGVLVGGDTNAWDGPLVICVTLLGEVFRPGPATRSSARAGDVCSSPARSAAASWVDT